MLPLADEDAQRVVDLVALAVGPSADSNEHAVDVVIPRRVADERRLSGVRVLVAGALREVWAGVLDSAALWVRCWPCVVLSVRAWRRPCLAHTGHEAGSVS